MANDKSVKENFKKYQGYLQDVRNEIAKIVVGQNAVVDGCLRGLLSNAHVLIEGLPGVAKTLLIRSLSAVSGCNFSRIQFTVDLLPADIVGITAYDKSKGFYTVKGPIFANFVIADEINRAPPKTQSALLEAMQEYQVTISKKTYKLDMPFFVMATSNNLESSGVYPLPEAQLDRFLFKLVMPYPSMEEEQQIFSRNINLYKFSDFNIKAVVNPTKIMDMQAFVKDKIYLDKKIEQYILRVTDATRNPSKYDLKKGHFIEFGVSPRCSIAMYIAAKADALLNNKNEYVVPQNIKNVAGDVLRHRLILNYEAQAEGVKPDDIIKEILSKVRVP